MHLRELESIIPGLAETREIEQRNRALAFSGLTHTLRGIELMPITPFHRLGLQLVQNAYALGRSECATPVDSFQLLWFLSVAYQNRATLGWWKTRRTRIRIARIVAKSDPSELRAEIALYIAMQLQDSPDGGDDNGPDYSGSIHWMAAEASFWLNVHGGFTLETYQHTPYLVLQQLHRMYRVNHPKRRQNPDGSWDYEYPEFFNRSDRLIGLFHRSNGSRIAEQLRRNTTRLPE